MFERLSVGQPLECLLGGETQRPDGACSVAGQHEVLRQPGRDLPWPDAVGDLEPLADPGVYLGSLPGPNQSVQHLPVQVVYEPVAGRERPVRPSLLAGRIDQLPRPRQPVAAPIDLVQG